MALFKNVDDIKRFLAGNQKNLSENTIMPFVEQAEIRYIIPVIGNEFFTELDEYYNPAEGDTPEANSKLDLAIARIQRSLAYYTLLDALPFLNVTVGNIGVQESNSEKSSPVRQWSYVELITTTTENADTFLDNALEFLEKKADDYTTWKESDAYTQSKELFINNAKELSKYLLTNNSRRVYLALRPFIARAEDLYIKPAIGTELFAEMKAYVLDSEQPEPYQPIVYGLIQKALAQLTLFLSIPEVQFVTTGFGLKLQGQMLAAGNKLTPALADIGPIKENAWQLADRYLTELKRYLDENAATIETYQNSTVYKSTTRRRYQLPDNSNSNSFRVK
ncbi:DUF6712 family protein [Xanthocytophaga flava]|uniref:DUF6712 family protein n=1 Tax=Xanthocytophaga flava TaxID=3048013 RepID=UPI0028D60E13|nr:DUF6712 family protein [Xanthocytophaga flavus]MDJ1468160.1 hypothetical protein [Xanthocytophaga flavus]